MRSKHGVHRAFNINEYPTSASYPRTTFLSLFVRMVATVFQVIVDRLLESEQIRDRYRF
ncbi:MAG: hypothetical protein ABJN26_07690 [Stappiaceae bacterium]